MHVAAALDGNGGVLGVESFATTPAGYRNLHDWLAAATAVSIIGTVSLIVWAVLEIARGESPFRRILGGLVLAAIAIGFLTR